MSDLTVDDAERTLYAGPRAAFVERRRELAAELKRSGDTDGSKRLAKLPKPTVAAHALNLLAHAGDERLTRVLDLGAAIRAAFESGDDVRELLQQRNAALAAAAAAASDASEERISGPARDQILQTLRAAMADADAATAVAGGTLADALDEPGFATLGAAPAPRTSDGRGSGDHAAHEAREAARADARAAVEAAVEQLAAATARRVDIDERVTALEDQLTALRADRDAAAAREAAAQDDRDRAVAALAALDG